MEGHSFRTSPFSYLVRWLGLELFIFFLVAGYVWLTSGMKPGPIIRVVDGLIGLFVAGQLVISAVVMFWQWYSRGYTITSEAIVVRSGSLDTEVIYYQFGDIQTITLSQGLVGRFFGYSDVLIYTKSGSEAEFVLNAIPNGAELVEYIKSRQNPT